MGQRRPPHFTEPKPPAFDEWDAKALAEAIARAAFAGRPIELQPAGEEALLWRVEVAGRSVGAVRRVDLDAPVWAAPCYGVEVAISRVGPARDARGRGRDLLDAAGAPYGDREVGSARVTYRPLPTTPAAEFDVALLVPESTPAATVERVIRRDAGELLERLTLFDEFRGAGVPDGHRSLAWRLTFRHPERTLRDKEVEGRRQKLLRTLESELGIRQRA
jgi:phenylalanyl-tRNA synthetase beta chain